MSSTEQFNSLPAGGTAKEVRQGSLAERRGASIQKFYQASEGLYSRFSKADPTRALYELVASANELLELGREGQEEISLPEQRALEAATVIHIFHAREVSEEGLIDPNSIRRAGVDEKAIIDHFKSGMENIVYMDGLAGHPILEGVIASINKLEDLTGF